MVFEEVEYAYFLNRVHKNLRLSQNPIYRIGQPALKNSMEFEYYLNTFRSKNEQIYIKKGKKFSSKKGSNKVVKPYDSLTQNSSTVVTIHTIEEENLTAIDVTDSVYSLPRGASATSN